MVDVFHARGRVLEVDRGGYRAAIDSVPVMLTRAEFDVLAALCSAPGQVLTRGVLLDRVAGGHWPGDGHSLEVLVSRLRSKLGETASDSCFVGTVRSVGYRFEGVAEAGRVRLRASDRLCSISLAV